MLFCLMLQWDAVEMMETSMTIVMSACLHTIILEIVAVMLMNSPLMVNGIRTMILLGLSLRRQGGVKGLGGSFFKHDFIGNSWHSGIQRFLRN